jgi:hypothetical protein
MSQVNKPSFAATAPDPARGSFPLVGPALPGFHRYGRREALRDSLESWIGDRAVAKGLQLAARQLRIEGAEP